MPNSPNFFFGNKTPVLNPYQARIRLLRQYKNKYPEVHVVDPTIDEHWSQMHSEYAPESMDSYFDYFFTGQDVVVAIDGVEDSGFKFLPMVSMGFRISQQKMPLYGAFSHTYDAVMRGTRIVEGSFMIATRYTNYMKDLLSTAANARHNKQGANDFGYSRPLTEDDANIEKYWTNTLDPTVVSRGRPGYLASGTNIFSTHPPFTFVILYGVQNVSLNPTRISRGVEEWLAHYDNDNAWFTDVNERLMADSDVANQNNRLYIDACELTSCEIGYASDGSVACETYTFFARDLITPSN